MENIPVVIYHDEKRGDVIKLLEEHEFKFNREIVIIPEGYESDGMSIPRFFWRFLSPQIYATTLIPSIEHDYLYDMKLGTRKEIDKYYQNRLKEFGYPSWKSTLAYWGVRIGGGSHW